MPQTVRPLVGLGGEAINIVGRVTRAAQPELTDREASRVGTEAQQAILTLTEAARELRCSKAHVSNMINGKVAGVPPIRSFRAGRRVLIKRQWIDEWLERSEKKAAG